MFYFFSNRERFQTLTFIAETEKHIIVIISINKGKVYKEMVISIWNKVFIRAKIKHSVHNRFMDTEFDLYL